MTAIPEVVIEGVAAVIGRGEPLPTLALESSRVLLESLMVELGPSRVEVGSSRVELGSSRVEVGSLRVELGPDGVEDSNLTLKDPNPTLTDPNLSNPTLTDPNLSNPTLTDPNLSNPTLTDPNLSNPTLKDSKQTLTDSNLSKSTLIDPNLTLNDPIVAVVAATFSNPDRFPSLAVRVASSLGLPASTPAFDVQMACSAYPYALYLAGRLSADLGGKVLVIDGDVQSPLVDSSDHATGAIFSDACTATLVSCNPFIASRSRFSFLSRFDDALTCAAEGPIRMDGFKVFTFVATEVVPFLREFLDGPSAVIPDFFAPHQANPYMVRQLADSLGLKKKLLTIPDEMKNPGSCSVPLALAMNAKKRGIAGSSVLVAGFGAGYSASAGLVAVSPDFTAVVREAGGGHNAK